MIDASQQPLNLKSFTGDLEIVGNGVAPAIKGLPLRIKIEDLEIEFEFNTDKSNDTRIERRVVEKKLFIVLTNFNNSLGTGIIDPMEFARLKNRKMYLSFWIWTPSSEEGKRIINWTILQGSEIIKTEE